jgi:hypothetical protein
VAQHVQVPQEVNNLQATLLKQRTQAKVRMLKKGNTLVKAKTLARVNKVNMAIITSINNNTVVTVGTVDMVLVTDSGMAEALVSYLRAVSSLHST